LLGFLSKDVAWHSSSCSTWRCFWLGPFKRAHRRWTKSFQIQFTHQWRPIFPRITSAIERCPALKSKKIKKWTYLFAFFSCWVVLKKTAGGREKTRDTLTVGQQETGIECVCWAGITDPWTYPLAQSIGNWMRVRTWSDIISSLLSRSRKWAERSTGARRHDRSAGREVLLFFFPRAGLHSTGAIGMSLLS